MNFFSVILVLIIIWIFLSTDNNKRRLCSFIVVGLLLDVTNFQGYFISLSGKELPYRDFYSLFMSTYCLFYLLSIKVEKYAFLCSILLIFSSLSGIFFESLFPYQNLIINSDAEGGWDHYVAGLTSKQYLDINGPRVFLTLNRVVEFSFLCLILKSDFKKKDLVLIFLKLDNWLKLILIYGVFEFISKNLLNLGVVNQINDFVLGAGKYTYSFGDVRNGLFSLQGTTREPSHFAYTLYFIIVYFYVKHTFFNKLSSLFSDKFCIILSCILLFISGSFSSFYFILCFFCFAFLFANKFISINKIKAKLFEILIIGIFLIFFIYILSSIYSDNYYFSRFDSVFRYLSYIIVDDWWGKVPAESQLIRMISIVEVLIDLSYSPIVGLGCGIQWAHSGFVTLLSNIGFLGVLLWYLLLSTFSKKFLSLLVIFLLVVLPNLLCGFAENLLSLSSILLVYFVLNNVVIRHRYACR